LLQIIWLNRREESRKMSRWIEFIKHVMIFVRRGDYKRVIGHPSCCKLNSFKLKMKGKNDCRKSVIEENWNWATLEVEKAEIEAWWIGQQMLF
jgi:hypothetical protein